MSGATFNTGWLSAAGAFIVGTGAFIGTASLEARQQPASDICVVTGTITGLGGPLPGVAITVRRGETVQTATSTDEDGRFRLPLPDAAYQVSFDLTGFTGTQRDLTVSKAAGCDQTVDATLELVPRTALAAAPAAGRGAAPAGQPGQGAGPRGGGNGGAQFEALEVNQEAATANLDIAAIERANQSDSLAPPSQLLPPGFGSEALADTVAFTGEAVRVDRGQLNDRRDAFNRGEFQFNQQDNRSSGGFGADGGQPNFQNFQGGGRGGRGGNSNQLGGRGFQQNAFRGNVNYTFNGSALNEAPLQLRSELKGQEAPFTNQQVTVTAETPVRFPGIYENSNNRTRLQFTYGATRGGNAFDRYSTVPTPAMRSGDFSEIPFNLIDPLTGQPFPNNRIPADRISPQALALLPYIPNPTLDGFTRNYNFQTTTQSVQNRFQVQLRHNFSGQQNQGRGGGGGQQATTSNAGRAGQGRRLLGARTNVNMTVQVQYNEGTGDQLNNFRQLGGDRETSSFGTTTSFNIQRGRVQHQLSGQYNLTDNQTLNRFSGVQNVAGEAGIQGVSQDPFSWGLPRIQFSSMTALSDLTPSITESDRFTTNYSWRRPFREHSVQMGGRFSWDRTRTNTESNANGTFVFTGLYTTGGVQQGQGGLVGFDFADFLLGTPQQATIQYGPGQTTLTGRNLELFVQDDWRIQPSMTLQVGVRYDLLWPFVEENGKMVNIDVNEDFTAAAPVESGHTGGLTGTAYPAALIQTDVNNVSPRIGLAWRAPAGLVVRPSYAVNYNSGTYSSIARQLAQQPPFATTGTNIGTLQNVLLMENALQGASLGDVTNNYGIDPDYVIGTVHQMNVDLQRQLGRVFQTQVNFSHTRGYSLDVVRAPNRNPDGSIRIDGVQPFYWTSSEGRSELNSASFLLQKTNSGGYSYRVRYTIAKSRDNSPSIGGGGGVGANVAQNDQDLDSEWAISNFDQRHALDLSAQWDLPFGPDRRWLSNGGVFAAIAGGWQMSGSFTATSGRPYSVTVRGSSRDIGTGLNGVLRADYNGLPVAIDNPTIDQYFNTDAFSIPSAGTYGSAPRNIIYGPGQRNLSANFQRQVRIGNRSVQIGVQVRNILSLANWTGIDTNVNSPTFGQVTGINGAREASLNMRFNF
jgi:hypothetical protein